MKKITSIIILLFAGIILSAQARVIPQWTDGVGSNEVYVGKVQVGDLQIVEKNPSDTVLNIVKSSDGEIFTYAAENPDYPGGNEAMKKFIEKNIVYPQISIDNGNQGTVIIGFTIEKDGSVSEVHAVKEILHAPQLTKEAIRVVSLFPKWAPGKMNGKTIQVKYNLPIKFYITSEIRKVQSSTPKPDTVIAKKQNEDSVYTWADEMPKFPGDSMNRFIIRNLKLPESYREKASFEPVFVSCIVEKDGSLSDIHTVKGDPEISKEVVRVFYTMPKWSPGKMNGEAVRVRMVLPVRLEPY
jgi:TonB family protein